MQPAPRDPQGRHCHHPELPSSQPPRGYGARGPCPAHARREALHERTHPKRRVTRPAPELSLERLEGRRRSPPDRTPSRFARVIPIARRRGAPVGSSEPAEEPNAPRSASPLPQLARPCQLPSPHRPNLAALSHPVDPLPARFKATRVDPTAPLQPAVVQPSRSAAPRSPPRRALNPSQTVSPDSIGSPGSGSPFSSTPSSAALTRSRRLRSMTSACSRTALARARSSSRS
jgi:hypothetical protein